MSGVSATSPHVHQAYRAWTRPVVTEDAPRVRGPAPDRRNQSVTVDLSDEARARSAMAGKAYGASGSEESRITDNGSGRREAPFAGKGQTAVNVPPGGRLDVSI